MRGGWWGLVAQCFPRRDHRILPQRRHVDIDDVPPSSSEPHTASEPEKVASRTSSFIRSPVNPMVIEDFRRQGSIIVFTYSELRVATKNFRSDQIIGEGGFGIVYKGIIDENVRRGFSFNQVAVKELDPEGLQGDREWLAEVNYLGQFSHPNLVRLIGYCCENEHRLLVYEFMARGSLEKHIFERIHLPMPWSTRMKIALDAAKGLAFLHGAERPIIYRDFKTSNILLDAHYNAKLSDFGLAKEGPMGDQTHVSTRVMGTYGYAAPEYVMTGHLTARSDVYTFGVVLVEMIIGGKAMDSNRPGRQHNLVEWARPLLIRNNKLPKIIDPRMDGQYSLKTAERVATLAYQCLSQNPKERPTMGEVVEVLAALQNPSDSEEGRSHRGRGNSTPLHEASQEASGRSPVGKRHSNKSGGEREAMQHYQGRSKPVNGRSRAENQKDYVS